MDLLPLPYFPSLSVISNKTSIASSWFTSSINWFLTSSCWSLWIRICWNIHMMWIIVLVTNCGEQDLIVTLQTQSCYCHSSNTILVFSVFRLSSFQYRITITGRNEFSGRWNQHIELYHTSHSIIAITDTIIAITDTVVDDHPQIEWIINLPYSCLHNNYKLHLINNFILSAFIIILLSYISTPASYPTLHVACFMLNELKIPFWELDHFSTYTRDSSVWLSNI